MGMLLPLRSTPDTPQPKPNAPNAESARRAIAHMACRPDAQIAWLWASAWQGDLSLTGHQVSPVLRNGQMLICNDSESYRCCLRMSNRYRDRLLISAAGDNREFNQ